MSKNTRRYLFVPDAPTLGYEREQEGLYKVVFDDSSLVLSEVEEEDEEQGSDRTDGRGRKRSFVWDGGNKKIMPEETSFPVVVTATAPPRTKGGLDNSKPPEPDPLGSSSTIPVSSGSSPAASGTGSSPSPESKVPPGWAPRGFKSLRVTPTNPTLPRPCPHQNGSGSKVSDGTKSAHRNQKVGLNRIFSAWSCKMCNRRRCMMRGRQEGQSLWSLCYDVNRVLSFAVESFVIRGGLPYCLVGMCRQYHLGGVANALNGKEDQWARMAPGHGLGVGHVVTAMDSWAWLMSLST